MRIRLKTLVLLVSPLLLLVAAAYIQWGAIGPPALASESQRTLETRSEPYGLPAWLRITYYVNFLFLVLLIRRSLCTTAFKDGQALPSGAGCRFRNW